VALVRAALRRDLPLLGICRGMQAINVAAGGTLLQHVPEIEGADEHMRTPGSFADADHAVRTVPGSVTERAAGPGEVIVKSHHHQAIERLGEGLAITGRAVTDDLPEAIEATGKNFAIGVQWHPEAADDDRVIPAMVAAARARTGG
jgi:putative glutamine amidotransferase